jgi:hypothetical protein
LRAIALASTLCDRRSLHEIIDRCLLSLAASEELLDLVALRLLSGVDGPLPWLFS